MNKSSILEVHSLVCHNHVEMAIMCLGSLLKFSTQLIKLVIHDDGSLTKEDQIKLKKGLNNVKIITRKEADKRMDKLLKNYPNCYKFRYKSPFFLKLLDIPLMSKGDIAFCDSDILFFRPFHGMFQLPDKKTSAIFMKDCQESYSAMPWQLTGPNKLKLISKVNSGIIFIHKKSYNLDFIEWLLRKKNIIPNSIFLRNPYPRAEQFCWAALGYNIGCRLFDPKQIVVMRPNTCFNDRTIAGHFVTDCRYRIKEFLPKIKDNKEKISLIEVKTIPAKTCTIFGTSEFLFKKLLKRVKGKIKYLLKID
jgi:hypothetical protein